MEHDPAVLLLTDNVPGTATLSWADWGRIAEWVGDLPIALDLLNRSLALSSITPGALLERVPFDYSANVSPVGARSSARIIRRLSQRPRLWHAWKRSHQPYHFILATATA